MGEFLAAMMCSRIKIHEDLVLGTFRRFDQDNSGYITMEDLRQVLGDCLDGEEVESLVREARVMTDGRISHEDFMAYLCGGNAQEAHQEVVGKIIDVTLARTPSASPRGLLTPSLTPKSART